MIYAFGEYELDITCYELRRSGQPQQIEPKVFDLLAYLVQQRDRAVSKDELFEQVWSNQFVSESALLYCIMAACKVLGDNGRVQRLIKTIHGRGYRFVGTVEESLSQKPPEPVEMAAQAAVLVHAAPVALELQTGEAGRRQLSVLYCRIAIAPAHTESIDPADVASVLQDTHEVCAEIIRRFDGHLMPSPGHGLLVYLGIPRPMRTMRTGQCG